MLSPYRCPFLSNYEDRVQMLSMGMGTVLDIVVSMVLAALAYAIFRRVRGGFADVI